MNLAHLGVPIAQDVSILPTSLNLLSSFWSLPSFCVFEVFRYDFSGGQLGREKMAQIQPSLIQFSLILKCRCTVGM